MELSSVLESEKDGNIKMKEMIVPSLKKKLEEEMSRTTALRADVVQTTIEVDRVHRLLKEEKLKVLELRTESEEHAMASEASSKRAESLTSKYESEIGEMMEKNAEERKGESERYSVEITTLRRRQEEMLHMLENKDEELVALKKETEELAGRCQETERMTEMNLVLRTRVGEIEERAVDCEHEVLRVTQMSATKDMQLERVQSELNDQLTVLEEERTRWRKEKKEREKEMQKSTSLLKDAARAAERKEGEARAEAMKLSGKILSLESDRGNLEEMLSSTRLRLEETSSRIVAAAALSSSSSKESHVPSWS